MFFRSNLLGKVLRLNVENVTVADYKLQYYDIPQDNPQKSGWRPEVYATGLRNPWRCTIDTGNFFLFLNPFPNDKF